MTKTRCNSMSTAWPGYSFTTRRDQIQLARDGSREVFIASDSMRMTFGLCSSTPHDRSRARSEESRCSSFPNTNPGRMYSWPIPHSGQPLPIPHVTEELDRVIGPGDVLVSKSTGNVLSVGAMGGLFGHVMLVVGAVRKLLKGSREARSYSHIFPDHLREVWVVPFVECTREAHGLHEALLLLAVDRNVGSIAVLAEESLVSGGLVLCDEDEVEAFQSPGDLRRFVNSCKHRSDLLAEVLTQMTKDMSQSQWSQLTAVRAALMSASLDKNYTGAKALERVRESWKSNPICTSVIVSFWQRYLCELARSEDAQHSAEHALELIHRWMPIRADRSLPGDLVELMASTGWIKCKPLKRVVSL